MNIIIIKYYTSRSGAKYSYRPTAVQDLNAFSYYMKMVGVKTKYSIKKLKKMIMLIFTCDILAH